MDFQFGCFIPMKLNVPELTRFSQNIADALPIQLNPLPTDLVLREFASRQMLILEVCRSALVAGYIDQ